MFKCLWITDKVILKIQDNGPTQNKRKFARQLVV